MTLSDERIAELCKNWQIEIDECLLRRDSTIRKDGTVTWETRTLDSWIASRQELVELCRLALIGKATEACQPIKVRGKVGEFATIVVSHSLVGQRVRIVQCTEGEG